MVIPENIAFYLTEIKRIQPASHKGQNGKVLLIGGSELFHAASRWALDVVTSMVDMVFYSSVPENNELIHEAKKEFWSGVVVPRHEIESYIHEADVVLLGPGMTRGTYTGYHKEQSVLTQQQWETDTEAITNYLVSRYPHKKWIIDAGALQMIDPSLLSSTMIMTPHAKELKMVTTHAEIIAPDGAIEFSLSAISKQLHNVCIVHKGPTDVIVQGKKSEFITGGNAGMTKGGTGDVLAGLIAGLYCFTNDPFVASVVGSFVNKKAGDMLYKEYGVFFKTNQLVEQIPKVLHELIR